MDTISENQTGDTGAQQMGIRKQVGSGDKCCTSFIRTPSKIFCDDIW